MDSQDDKDYDHNGSAVAHLTLDIPIWHWRRLAGETQAYMFVGVEVWGGISFNEYDVQRGPYRLSVPDPLTNNPVDVDINIEVSAKYRERMGAHARLGYATGRKKFYMLGGWHRSHVEFEAKMKTNQAGIVNSFDLTNLLLEDNTFYLNDWYAGVGSSYKLWDHVLVQIQAAYYRYRGSVRYKPLGNVGAQRGTIDDTTYDVSLGLALTF